MEQVNRSFVTDAGERAQIGVVLTAIANGTDGQLFHCSGGKDRTGWIAAVLQTLLGMSQNAVMKDYLLTNTYMAALVQSTYESLTKANGQACADAYYPMFLPKESYLMAGLDQIAASYGSMSDYVANGLGVSEVTQATLRAKLLG